MNYPDFPSLKPLIVEMPKMGGYLDPEAKYQLQKLLSIEINSGLLGAVKVKSLTDDIFFITGGAQGPWGKWAALFKKVGDTNKLLFATGFEATNWDIDDLPTYKVHISAKYGDFPKHAASTAYLELIKMDRQIVLTSGNWVTDAGSGIWQELLTRPDLQEEIFVWNIKERKRETVLDWKDIFGRESSYENLVIALKTKS